MRSIRFALLAAFALVGSVSAITVASDTPAEAFTVAPLKLELGKPIDVKYRPILVPYPGGSVVGWTPSGCGNGTPEDPEGAFSKDPQAPSDLESPPPAGATCDRININIVRPKGMSASDDFIVSIELSWIDDLFPPGCGVQQEVNGILVKVTCGPDLDLYIYDNTQLAHRKNPEEEGPGYTKLYEARTIANPEHVRLGNPDLGDYNLVVQNAGGIINSGYRIRASMKVVKSDPVFELLEDQSAPPLLGTAPPDLAAAPSLPSLTGITDLAPAALEADFELDPGVGPSRLTKQLEAPTPELAVARSRPPKPVSGATVALWLVLVPLVLVGGGILLLIRRGALGSRLA